MKNLLFCLALLLGLQMYAQDCPNYYPLREGASWQLTSYNAKDKVESVSDVLVKSFGKVGNNFEASCEAKHADEKGKPLGIATFVMKCVGGVLYYDMKTFFDPKTMEQYKDMDIKITASDMQYPAKLAVGMTLPDASITMEIASGPMTITNVVNVTDRKVIASETITVPAGTFTCFVLSYDVSSKFGFMKIESSIKEWIAVGAGMVRSENYSKGKLQGYQLLTKLSV